jgi:hypothetical protein
MSILYLSNLSLDSNAISVLISCADGHMIEIHSGCIFLLLHARVNMLQKLLSLLFLLNLYVWRSSYLSTGVLAYVESVE